MDKHGTFVARLLDASLRGLASEVAVYQRRALEARGIRLAAADFHALVGDTEARILVLAEALATGRAALFQEQLEWNRSAFAARDVGDDRLALNLECLREVLLRELPPSAHDAVSAILDPVALVFEHPPRAIESVIEGDAPDASELRLVALAILEGRRDDALRLLLEPLERGRSPIETEDRIIAPLQAEFGRMWQRGELHIHEEHVGSQIIADALVLLRSRIERREPNGKSVLISSVAGNLHDIGARIVADHFELHGWNTLRLGANVPGEDLGRAVADFGVDLVALSVTMTNQVRNTASAIEAMRAFCESQKPPVLVGGPPFSSVPDLWQVVGADGSADNAAAAVLEARRLVPMS